MVRLIKITKSKNPKKKFTALFKLEDDKFKSVSFGARGMRDFTLISNPDSKFYIEDEKSRNLVKKNYIKRHTKDLKTEDNKKGIGAGALSMFVLWNKSSMSASIKDYKRRFKL